MTASGWCYRKIVVMEGGSGPWKMQPPDRPTCPRSHMGRAWALILLTGQGRRVFVRWGKDSSSSCPAGLQRPPLPCPNKGLRRPLKQLSRRDAGVQTAQCGGLAAKVRPEPQAQEPGKHTRAAASGPCLPLSPGQGWGHRIPAAVPQRQDTGPTLWSTPFYVITPRGLP